MDKVKAKVQELCPDVMELKFGCEIIKSFRKSDFGHTEREYEVRGTVLRVNRNRSIGIVEDVSVLFVGNKNTRACEKLDLKILGSPVTLAVVLRAIAYSLKSTEARKLAWYKLTEMWEMAFNYDQQSEECKQFIGSLLGV